MLFLTYLIYSLISFTFTGIMALLLRDWDWLFLSLMCLTYRNRSDYWSTCPLQVKRVNRSIAILMTKKLSPVLEGLHSAWHEIRFRRHSKKDALKNLEEYWLLTEISSVNCITSLYNLHWSILYRSSLWIQGRPKMPTWQLRKIAI